MAAEFFPEFFGFPVVAREDVFLHGHCAGGGMTMFMRVIVVMMLMRVIVVMMLMRVIVVMRSVRVGDDVTVFIHVGVGMAAAAAAGCAHNVFLQNLFRNFKIQYAQFMPLRCREMVTPAFGAGFAVPVQGNFFAAVQAPGFPRGCFNRKARAL